MRGIGRAVVLGMALLIAQQLSDDSDVMAVLGPVNSSVALAVGPIYHRCPGTREAQEVAGRRAVRGESSGCSSRSERSWHSPGCF
jgi:hypothetical protein